MKQIPEQGRQESSMPERTNKHTKGPITVRGLKLYAERGGQEELIGIAATLRCTGDGSDEDAQKASDEENANVQLWAAAPELLDALKAAQEELRLIRMKDCNVVYNPGLQAQMKLAIAQATGEVR